MAKTDWTLLDTVQPEDMNQIGQEINELRTDLDGIEIPPASTTQAGIVQLSDATNGTRSNVAASEKAVGLAFQAGNERKAELVAALVAKGVAATTSETWAQLLAKVTALIKATGNATADKLLSGETASNSSGPITGTMPNQGAKIITPSTVNQPITAGYHNGSGYVAGDTDLIASNIRAGVNIFGLIGTLQAANPGLYVGHTGTVPPSSYVDIHVPIGGHRWSFFRAHDYDYNDPFRYVSIFMGSDTTDVRMEGTPTGYEMTLTVISDSVIRVHNNNTVNPRSYTITATYF